MPASPATSRSTRVPFVIILGLLLLLGITSSCQDADTAVAPAASDPATAARFSSQAGGGAIPDRYIVTFQAGVADPAALAYALASAHGGKVHHTYTHVLQGFALTVPPQALEGIRRNPNVKAVEPDQMIELDGVQSPATWGIDRIDQAALPLNSTYNFETDASTVTAYIFDTGIRYDHAEFEGRARFGFDAFGDGRNGLDCHGHGTHVAGTVGGKTFGVAKKVSLVAVRVLDCTAYGAYSGMIAGMDWVVKNNQGPAVANFSLGGSVSTALNSALTNMINTGIQTAVSAGNNSADACTKSPASTAAAVTVGATTTSDARASYSNFGSCIDVFAPGSSITSAAYGSTTGSAVMSGTSMAAPHATGVLALLRAQRPDITSQQLRDWLVETLSARNIVVNANSTNAHLLQSIAAGSAPPDAPALPPPTEPVVTSPPAAPANLRAELKAKTNVKLSWTDLSTSETGFTIERQDATGLWSRLANVGSNVISYTDAATQRGQSYTYRVYAFNSIGASGTSNLAAITIGTSTNGRK